MTRKIQMIANIINKISKLYVSKIILLCISITLMIFLSINNSDAEVPITTDSRIKTLIYNENEVFSLTFHPNYQSYIMLGKTEKIQTIAMGDPTGWNIRPHGNKIFIKPVQNSLETNMIIFTNKRNYQFQIISSSLKNKEYDESLVYVAKFFYPENTFDKLPIVQLNTARQNSSFSNDKLFKTNNTSNLSQSQNQSSSRNSYNKNNYQGKPQFNTSNMTTIEYDKYDNVISPSSNRDKNDKNTRWSGKDKSMSGSSVMSAMKDVSNSTRGTASVGSSAMSAMKDISNSTRGTASVGSSTISAMKGVANTARDVAMNNSTNMSSSTNMNSPNMMNRSGYKLASDSTKKINLNLERKIIQSQGKESMNYNYTYAGSQSIITPIKVFDDGKATYIELVYELQPKFFKVNYDGSESPITVVKVSPTLYRLPLIYWQYSIRLQNNLICLFNDNLIY